MHAPKLPTVTPFHSRQSSNPSMLITLQRLSRGMSGKCLTIDEREMKAELCVGHSEAEIYLSDAPSSNLVVEQRLKAPKLFDGLTGCGTLVSYIINLLGSEVQTDITRSRQVDEQKYWLHGLFDAHGVILLVLLIEFHLLPIWKTGSIPSCHPSFLYSRRSSIKSLCYSMNLLGSDVRTDISVWLGVEE